MIICDIFPYYFSDNKIYCIIQRTPSKMARDDDEHPVSVFHYIPNFENGRYASLFKFLDY